MLKRSIRVALFAILWCVIVSAAWAQEFRFTTTADSRGSSGFRDTLIQIKNLVGDEGFFHITPGDTDPADETFADLKAAFGNDVIWIPVMGNHDGGDESWISNHNQTLPFTINWSPRNCDQQTTFSFDYENAHFIILDEYCVNSGDIDQGLYDWLVADLNATQQPAIFVFGHEPAYPFHRHTSDSLNSHKSNRDRFWQLLHDKGVVAYIVGHTHYPSAHQESGYDPWQVDAGQARGDGSDDSFVDVIVRDSEVQLSIYRGSAPFTLWWTRTVQIEPSTPPIPPYTLTVNTIGEGSVSLEPYKVEYDQNAVVTLTAAASLDWEFDQWEDDLGGSVNPETITMDTNKNVTAVFKRIGVGDPIDVRVSASYDDAEEKADGSVSGSSSDLELVFDGSDQMVGMRFNSVDIPQGATITNAYVQFQVDETNSGATSLTIQGEDTNNAPSFTSSSGNISSRARTTASVSWDPAPWTTTGVAGTDQRTPNIASVIQEIVKRSDWSSGNSLAIIITGTGERTAESYNGSSSGAPLLHVEYVVLPGNEPVSYTLTVELDGDGMVTLNPDGGTYADGTLVTVNAVPYSGWEFNQWSGDLSGTQTPETITMNSDKTVTATFNPETVQYTLAYTSDGGGTVTFDPPGGVYNEGTVVTLTANPNQGWVFKEWGTDLSGSQNPTIITMNSNKDVIAGFVEPTKYTLSVNSVGQGTVTLDSSGGPYSEGTNVTLEAVPDSGW